MAGWEYRIAYIDYSGRISIEGEETLIGQERKTTFVRRFLDQLGNVGWELSAIQPVSPHAAYYVFKRQATETHESASSEQA
ncbi:MAG: hypothetical protein ACHQ4H_06225 [Ktedonobacterales bacterium]